MLWIWQKKSSNIKDLGSHIWDSWADENGSIGKAYGYQLGVKHQDFLFSKNMMSDATPKFAFFDVPDAFGMVSEDNSIIYDNKTQKIVYDQGRKGYNLKRGQAYLQKLYDDIASKK